MTRSIGLVMVAVVVLGQPGPLVFAQTPAPLTKHKQPTQKEIDQARAHFKAAEAAKSRGEYKTAAIEYFAAYELFADPEFFFDVAEVYRLAGEDQEALTYYEKYLELDPNGRGATAARDSTDQLRRSIAARQDAAKLAADEEARRNADADARRAVDEAARTSAAQLAEAQRREPPGRSLRLAGITIGGAGIVALGVGVFFGLRAQSISNEVSNASAYDASLDHNGKAANRNMVIFTATGGVAVITGGILYYLGHRAGEAVGSDTRVTLVPLIAPSHVTIMAQGHF